MRTELTLQTMTGKKFDSRSTIVWDEARLDINAGGFWTKYQIEYFHVRVFDPNAKRYESKSLQQNYRKNEIEKKQKYTKRILQVENGSSPH